jgi:murein L,D-transpeptidase YafK
MRAQILVLGVSAALSISGISKAGEVNQPCALYGTALVVETASHKLRLCSGNKAYREFAIAIGRGGTGKRLEGDNKTPLGEYALGLPRPSERFGLFVPVSYPTKSERAQGFTGGDIGVHGPPRYFRWLGTLTTWVDWTRGCIAVGSDDAISEVARWMDEQKVEKIIIR